MMMVVEKYNVTIVFLARLFKANEVKLGIWRD